MTDGREPRVHSYADGEFLLAYGPKSGPQLLVLQPLFEEMNRCRAFVARLCRLLASRGYGCWLPDPAGCGESVRSLDDVDWSEWTDGVARSLDLMKQETGAAAFGTVAIRAGALLDVPSPRRWRLSPVTGASLLTDLRRSGLLASDAYSLSGTLAEALSAAEPEGEARVVRLDGDKRSCDLRVPGPALWRRPEPEDAPDLAALIAEDINGWAKDT